MEEFRHYRKAVRRKLVRIAGHHDRCEQRFFLEELWWTTLLEAYEIGVRIPRSLRGFRRNDPFTPVPPRRK